MLLCIGSMVGSYALLHGSMGQEPCQAAMRWMQSPMHKRRISAALVKPLICHIYVLIMVTRFEHIWERDPTGGRGREGGEGRLET